MSLIDKAIKQALEKKGLIPKYNTVNITRQPNTRFAHTRRNKSSKFSKNKKQEF